MGPEETSQWAVRVGLLVGELMMPAVDCDPSAGVSCKQDMAMTTMECSSHFGHFRPRWVRSRW